MKLIALLLLSSTIEQLAGSKCGKQTTCSGCVTTREGFLSIDCRWCVQDNGCHNFPDFDCPETSRIGLEYDCPVPERNGYDYDDAFARTKALPLSAAAYSDNPQIIVSYRGTSGTWQLVVEGGDSIFKRKRNFPGGGKADEYFYNAFYSLWNAGMHQDLLTLHAANPGYTLWVTGHSLGGSMASLCSSLVVTLQMWPASKVKMVTFGQPRTGDLNYAQAHDQRVYYSYRVVHQKDLVAHIPPKFPDNWFDTYYHHRYEVWYDNDMARGSAYQVCTRADDDTCSNTQTDLSISDHLHYFGVDVSGYGEAGCQ